ncbi:MAG: hypothetical protein ACXAC6_12035 [Candidatus Hodarchaeales archaeon]|jgi:hypothetical protein
MGKVMRKLHAVSVKYNSENLKFRRRSYYEDGNAQLENYLGPVEDAIVFEK